MSEQDKPRGPVAIESLPWVEWSEGVRFGSRARVLSDTRGPDKRKVGVAYEELPPRKQSVPFHFHTMEEEHILALEGEATLRLGDERHTIRAGDYVCFPAGERVGHCLINEGDKPFRFIIIGTNEKHDVCVYPDSGKINVDVLSTETQRAIFRESTPVDYWDGERADEPIK